MTDHAEPQQALPGLEQQTASSFTPALEEAARRTLRALWSAGTLREEHALMCQLVIELARAVDAGNRSGKASAVAMAAAQLREAWEALLPTDPGSQNGDAFDQLAADLRTAAGLAS